MGVQFNLLPDVKLEYIRAQRMKRTVMGISLGASAAAFAIFIGLFMIVNVVQRGHINNLNADISEGVAKLKAVPDIDKVLTVQNQLNSLPGLHEQKPAASRAIDYLGQLTPQQANISEATVNFDQTFMTVIGGADSLVTVNKFADTLKFTKFTVEGGEEQNAFSDVVLSSFGVTNDDASYQIDFKFNPEIFNNTKKINLVVPNIISTRSQTEKPSALFQQTGEEGQ